MMYNVVESCRPETPEPPEPPESDVPSPESPGLCSLPGCEVDSVSLELEGNSMGLHHFSFSICNMEILCTGVL